uniref:Uncharacterized protein n=1 Tax=Drosophila pseudoobscura pseudoobscura TaxID=46245 RepID=A0A0R3P2I8_DROPS
MLLDSDPVGQDSKSLNRDGPPTQALQLQYLVLATVRFGGDLSLKEVELTAAIESIGDRPSIPDRVPLGLHAVPEPVRGRGMGKTSDEDPQSSVLHRLMPELAVPDVIGNGKGVCIGSGSSCFDVGYGDGAGVSGGDGVGVCTCVLCLLPLLVMAAPSSGLLPLTLIVTSTVDEGVVLVLVGLAVIVIV